MEENNNKEAGLFGFSDLTVDPREFEIGEEITLKMGLKVIVKEKRVLRDGNIVYRYEVIGGEDGIQEGN